MTKQSHDFNILLDIQHKNMEAFAKARTAQGLMLATTPPLRSCIASEAADGPSSARKRALPSRK